MVPPFATARMFCASHDNLKNPDFVRTAPTYSKVFLRSLWVCGKRRTKKGFLKLKTKIEGNHAFFRDN